MAHSSNVTKRLLDSLLRDQRRRAERERKMPFAKKLMVIDELMKNGVPTVEDVKDLGRHHGDAYAREP